MKRSTSRSSTACRAGFPVTVTSVTCGQGLERQVLKRSSRRRVRRRLTDKESEALAREVAKRTALDRDGLARVAPRGDPVDVRPEEPVAQVVDEESVVDRHVR